MNGFQRFVLWDYPRASVQYDIMVALILAFVFITPREWFKDQPKASSMVMLPAAAGSGTGVFWIEADVLSGVPEVQRPAKATELLKTRLGHKRVVRVEPLIDSEQELKGFMAFTGQ